MRGLRLQGKHIFYKVPVVHLAFVLEGDHVLFMLEAGTVHQSEPVAAARIPGVHVVMHAAALLNLKHICKTQLRLIRTTNIEEETNKTTNKKA